MPACGECVGRWKEGSRRGGGSCKRGCACEFETHAETHGSEPDGSRHTAPSSLDTVLSASARRGCGGRGGSERRGDALHVGGVERRGKRREGKRVLGREERRRCA
eukprot:2094042-Rhodomonas_salina.1